MFLFLLWHFGWHEVYSAVRNAQLFPLCCSALLTLAGFWLRAWKWRWVIGPNSGAVAAFFLSKTAGSYSPARLGELAPLLLRQHRTPRMTAWILTDRVVEAGCTVVLGLIGAYVLGVSPKIWAVMIILGLILGLLTLFYLSGRSQRGVMQPDGGEKRASISRLRHLLRETGAEARRFTGYAHAIFLTTGLAKLTDILAVMLLIAAFGFDASFWMVCAARWAHAMVSAIPATPDATGVPFVAAAYVLNHYGGIPSETLIAAFALEVAIIHLALWASFFATAHGLHRRP